MSTTRSETSPPGTPPGTPPEAAPEGVGRKALIGVLWSFIQNAYVNIAGLVGMIVLARLVTPHEFGLVASAFAIIALVSIVTDMGLTPALVRLQHPSEDQKSSAFWVSLALGLVLGGALAAAAGLIARGMHEPELRPILWVLALQIPIASLRIVPNAELTRAMRFRALTIRQVIAETLATAAAILLAFAGAGAWALVVQSLGTVVVNTVVVWVAVRWRPRFRVRRKESAELLRFGLPALLTNTIHMGRDQGVQLLISVVLGPTALAMWVIATKVCGVALQLFASVINSVALPAFAAVRADRSRLEGAVRQAVRMNAALSVPALLGIAAVSPTLIPLLFGPHWTAAIPLAVIASVTAAVTVIQWTDGELWWALGRPGIELALTAWITGLHLVVAGVSAHWGIEVFALALLARTLFSVPTRLIALKRYSGLSLKTYADVPAAAVTAAAMYLGVFLIGRALGDRPDVLTLLIEVAAGVAIYLGLSLLLQRRVLLDSFAQLRGVLTVRKRSRVLE